MMTTSVPDDATLKRLATEPPRGLFPVLRQAEAMAPLVVVLAFLPTLYALAHRTLTPAGAEQGLLSLRCLSSETLSAFVDPVEAGADVPLSYQPLLMNWITAFFLHLFGVGQPAGYVCAAYLATAALIVSTYLLGRRFGGEILGLCSALLIAFNPHVLRLAQEPLPQSSAMAFCLLAFTGAVAHWQKSSGIASLQLLLGGIALGLCLLAGGALAIAVVLVLILYAAFWKLDAWRRGTSLPPDAGAFSRRNAVRSILILAATGFAAGAWRSMLMGSRYGMDFWEVWLGWGQNAGNSPALRNVQRHRLLELNDLMLPLGVCALAGLGLIVAEIWRGRENPGRRHRGLILVWSLLAGLLWWFAAEGSDPASLAVGTWEIFLIVPATLAAAVTVVAIIERRIPFSWAVSMAFLSLLDVALTSRLGTHVHPGAALVQRAPGGGWPIILGVALLIGGAGILSAQFGRLREARQRRLLTAIILLFVVGNCIWGGLEVRRTSFADRELEEIRGALARVEGVRHWILLAPPVVNGASPEPPPQLVFLLMSLWPQATMEEADSWEQLPGQLEKSENASPGKSVVVAVSPRAADRPAIPVGGLRSAVPSQVYRGFEVTAYLPGKRGE